MNNSLAAMSFLNQLRLLLLGSWLGAAIFFSAVVAPRVFRVLRAFNVPHTSEIAGTIVSATLSIVNLSGFIVSLIVLITAVVLKSFYTKLAIVSQIVLMIIVAITTAISEWVIAPRMRALRAASVLPMDQLAASDAVRVAFDALHGYSVAALGIAVIAGLIAFFIVARRTHLERP